MIVDANCYLIHVGCLWGKITGEVFKVVVDVLEEMMFACTDDIVDDICLH